jgi:acyl carrier protein
VNGTLISTTSLRDLIVAAYRDALRDDGLGPDSDFYEAGGDSMTAVQITGRLRAAFGIEVSVATVFASPTPDDLAVAVGALAQPGIAAN